MSTFSRRGGLRQRSTSPGGAKFLEQRLEDVLLRHVGDLFALHVDDAAAVAGEDGDVGAFAFAGPFTTQPITATLIGRRISFASCLRTSCTSLNRSTWMRPAGGAAISSAPMRVRRPRQ
jgi:hypothetical protein